MQNPPVPIENFDLYIERLGRALGYNIQQIPDLRTSFRNFNRQDKYKLIQNTQEFVDRLLDADQQLQALALPNGILEPYMDEIGDNWYAMNEQLVQLQILSLIQKKEDCQAVIKELLKLLSNKIKTVNEVLKANLEQPPSNPPQQPQQPQQFQQFQQDQMNSQGDIANRLQSLANRTFPAPRFQAAANNPSLRSRTAAELQEQLGQQDLRLPEAGGGVRNLRGGSNDNVYMNKYLKYKNKYLSLKKNSI